MFIILKDYIDLILKVLNAYFDPFLGAIRIYVYTYSISALLHIILALKVRLAISKAKLYFEKNAFLFSLRQHGPTKEKKLY